MLKNKLYKEMRTTFIYSSKKNTLECDIVKTHTLPKKIEFQLKISGECSNLSCKHSKLYFLFAFFWVLDASRTDV